MNKNMQMMDFWDELASDGSWGSHYDGAANLRTYNFYTRRTAVMKLLEGDGDYRNILDLGCGTGDYTEIAERHHGNYYGIDYAKEMIAKALNKHANSSTPSFFQVGSGEDLPYKDDFFDLVVAMGYVEYFEDPSQTLTEIHRILRPGGTLVLQSFKDEMFSKLDKTVFNPLLAAIGRPGPNPKLPDAWVDKQYTKRQLDDLLKPYGFACKASVFNNFYPMPGRLRMRYQRAYVRMSEIIDKTAPNLFGFLATNYVGKYALSKEGYNGKAGAAQKATSSVAA